MLPLLFTFLFGGCEPKDVVTETEYLSDTSLAWYPFSGYSNVVFEIDTAELEFYSTGVEIYFERVRYMTESGGFTAGQENYYASMERRKIEFVSDSTTYTITYLLERNKGEIGDWDVLRVILADGAFQQNEVKIITFRTSGWDYGESPSRAAQVLNGKTFSNVYFNEQERRPQALYVNRLQGVVGFKSISDEVWTLK